MNKKRQFKILNRKNNLLGIFIPILMFCFCATIPFTSKANNRSVSNMQVILQKKISVSIDNKSLKYILTEIQRLSGIEFGIEKESGDSSLESLSLHVKDVTVEQALTTLLAKTNYTFQIIDNIITILKKEVKKESPAQIKKILFSGVVLDADKKPIVGATVLVVGTPVGAITDTKGAFTFIANSNSTIEVSFTGKKSVVVKENEPGKFLSIILKDDALAVEDVVVTGYQTVNRKDMVGSQTTIKAENIQMSGVNNISEMLQGQVAGMIVTNSSSRVGATPKIKIRGTTTFGNTDPLFVVDGIIQPDPIQMNASSGIIEDMKTMIGDQVSWLNPSDINTITVLKDASATAIYGARASNGVIVITTKKPKHGDRLSISYRGSLSVTPRPNYDQFNFMNSQERIIFSEEAFAAGARYSSEPIQDDNTYEGVYAKYLAGAVKESYFIERKKYLEGLNTDWFDLLTCTTVSQQHNISVSGASEKATYRVSAGYNRTLGQEIGNDQDRFTVNSNVGLELHRKVKLTFGINATIDNTAGFGSGVNPLFYATQTSRSIPAYENDGTYAYHKILNSYQYNSQNAYLNYSILNERDNSESSIFNAGVNGSLNFSWEITNWLKYEFTGGASYKQADRDMYMSEKTTYVAKTHRGYDYNTVDPMNPWYTAALLPHGGEKFTSSASNQSYNIQNKLIFQKAFNDDSRLNVMLAMEISSSANRDNQNTIYGFSADKGNKLIPPTHPDKFKSLGNATFEGFGLLNGIYSGKVAQSEYTNNFMSLFMTAAYSFKDRYVVNANIRNDRSNRFGQDTNRKFDPTFSVGGAWRLSSEPWMDGVNHVFSNVNFKVTYGIQGNANLSTSPDLILIQQAIVPPFGDFGASISSIPNSNLAWERTNSWNFGFDFQLFNKLNFVVDYYTRKSNAVISRDIPLSNGVRKMNINGGILYNNGIEATISFNPQVSKNVGFNISVNGSRNWNRGGESPFEAKHTDYLRGSNTSVLKKGYPVDGFWSYEFLGLNPENGFPKFNNMDVDPDVAMADPTTVLVYSGSKEPYFTGGLNLGFRYKNLTFSTSFTLLLGGNKRLSDPYDNFSYGRYLPKAESNISRDLNNRWKKPGDEKITNIPSILDNSKLATPFLQSEYYTGSGGLYSYSSALVASSSFLRCRDLSINYRMNSKVIKKIGLDSFSIGASVNNLFVIASKRYNGFDPELNNSVKPQTYSLNLSFGF